MEDKGKDAINAVEVAEVASQRVAAIENVTPEVNQLTRDSLQALVTSHERKSQITKVQAGFWGFVANTFGKDPAERRRAISEQKVQAGAQYIRETGATGRALSTEDESRHQKNREAAKREMEKVEKPKRLTLREKMFNWANERAMRAMAKHEQLNTAIGSLREQISQVQEKVGEALQENVQNVQDDSSTHQEELYQSAEQFRQAIDRAKDTNYTGYGQPRQQEG
jgi:hypothetical protein